MELEEFGKAFTFQYVSINTSSAASRNMAYANLHSNMFLLILCTLKSFCCA